MKRITAIIITVCMAVTGAFTGIPQMIITGDDMTAAAASYPALKTIKYKATGNQRKDIVGFAKSQLGYAEGKNNNTYFGHWFGCNYNPWCAMFVSWSAAKAGVSKSVVPRLATADRSWAKNQKVYHKSKYWGGSYTPKSGDLIYFSWSVRDYADHIGMVTGTEKSGGTTYVKTIEGNKHDKVVEGSYALNNRYILGYASPKYTTGDAPEETTEETTSKYTLKFRDGLDSTSNDEEDEILSPVKCSFGKDVTMPDAKFTRKGYKYTKWDVYREKNSKLIYLCRDTSTQTKEKWYEKSAIPSDYEQVIVDCGGVLRINDSVSGTVYASPVWKLKTYKITYDANGGTGAPETQKKKYNKDLTLSKEKPSKDKCEFRGWATSKTAADPEYKGGETYKKNAKLSLYAVWDIEAFDVKTTKEVTSRAKPDGDSKKVSTIASGTKVTIKKLSGNWGKMKDGSWINLKYTMKLNVKKYQLTYDDGDDSTKDDSSIIAPVTVKYGDSVQTSTKKFTRDGQSYSKWQFYYLRNGKEMYLCKNKESGKKEWHKDGNVPDTCKRIQVKPGESVTIKKSVGETIYATPVWDEVTFKVKYKANGGKNAPKAQKKTYGKTLKLSKDKPKKEGAKFLGWATKASATKAKYQPGDKYTKNKSVTLYAVWKSKWKKVKTTDEVNKRKGPGTEYDVVGVIAKGKTVTIVKTKNGWGKLKSGSWISLSLTKKVKSSSDTSTTKSTKKSSKKAASTDKEKEKDADTASDEDIGDVAEQSAEQEQTFTVEVTSKEGVNVRSGAGKDHDVVSSHETGESLVIVEIKDGWGRLKDSESWLLLKNTKITEGYKVEITSSDLNQRSGPGLENESEGYIEPGTYEITKINGDWGKVKETGNWIKLEYAKRVN